MVAAAALNFELPAAFFVLLTMSSDLTFGSPVWLWGLRALPFITVLFFWSEAESKRRLARLVQTPRLRGQLTTGVSVGRRRVRYTFLILALACLFAAAAEPRWGYETRDVHRRGLDVIVVADVSKSMLAKDLPPNRLLRAKLAVQDLTMQLQGDRLGLVAFAGDAFLQAPLTLDYDAVLAAAGELDTDLIPRGGTNLGGAIDLALEAFGKAEGGNRAIILLSDGEPTDDTEQGKGMEAAARAAEAGVKIYTVGFGTPEGALIPLPGDGNFVRDQDGKIVRTSLNEAGLTALAKAANGFYVRFTGDASMRTVVTQGLSQLKTGEIDARQTRHPIERYRWPLGAGILFLTLAMLFGERRRTRATPAAPRQMPAPAVAAVLVALGCLGPQVRAEDAKPEQAPSGSALDLYRAGHYKEAYRAFEDLAEKNPQMNNLQFNAGTSAYMGKQYDDALEAFNKTLTSADPGLQAKANYNFANTLFRRGEGQEDRDKKIKDWRNAVEHYKSTLDTLKRPEANAADPRSQALAKDTAYNRDLVQKRLDELLKEPPKPPSGSPQNKDDKSEGKQSGDPSDQNQPPKPDQSPAPDQKQQGQGQSPPGASPPPSDPSGQTSDQKTQADQPPKSGPSPSPSPSSQGGDKSGSQDQKNDPSKGGQQPGQTPDPGSQSKQDKPRQRGDFQSQPGGASPVPTPGSGQPTPGEAPDEAGKMSPAQARALLDSLKDQDEHVNFSDPAKTHHSQDERVLKDW